MLPKMISFFRQNGHASNTATSGVTATSSPIQFQLRPVTGAVYRDIRPGSPRIRHFLPFRTVGTA